MIIVALYSKVDIIKFLSLEPTITLVSDWQSSMNCHYWSDFLNTSTTKSSLLPATNHQFSFCANLRVSFSFFPDYISHHLCLQGRRVAERWHDGKVWIPPKTMTSFMNSPLHVIRAFSFGVRAGQAKKKGEFPAQTRSITSYSWEACGKHIVLPLFTQTFHSALLYPCVSVSPFYMITTTTLKAKKIE